MGDDNIIKLNDKRQKAAEPSEPDGFVFSEADAIKSARMKTGAVVGMTINPNNLSDEKLMDAISLCNEAWAELVSVLIFRGRFF